MFTNLTFSNNVICELAGHILKLDRRNETCQIGITGQPTT